MSKANAIAVTYDSWTSVATEFYVTVTHQYMSEEWKICHVLQVRAVRTQGNIWQSYCHVLLKYKELVVVTDSASNMIVATQFGQFKHVRIWHPSLGFELQCLPDFWEESGQGQVYL